jgi:hypothetical protein
MTRVLSAKRASLSVDGGEICLARISTVHTVRLGFVLFLVTGSNFSSPPPKPKHAVRPGLESFLEIWCLND